MDKKLQPKEDVRITKQASAFAQSLRIKDYHPQGLALFAYYEGRKDEYLASHSNDSPCSCGVPEDAHGTSCGWGNAKVAVNDDGVILTPGHPYQGRNLFVALQNHRIDVANWIARNNPYTNPTAAQIWKEGVEAYAAAFPRKEGGV